jgi:hypothetical protein
VQGYVVTKTNKKSDVIKSTYTLYGLVSGYAAAQQIYGAALHNADHPIAAMI